MNYDEDFALNGRFLAQPVTGVQRYARNVTAAIDALLRQQGGAVQIIAPAGVEEDDRQGFPIAATGPLTGHLWEQVVLPSRWQGRLLNLCNTAPAIKSDQIVCVHDVNTFLAPESYGEGFRRFYGLLQPVLARRSARITTVSTFSARQIAQQFSLPVGKVAVLPNGHEHALLWDPNLAERAPAALLDHGHGADRPFVLAIGSRSHHKNLALLEKVAPDLAKFGVDIVVAGGTAGIFTSQSLHACPNMKLMGHVTDHDLAFLLDRALCLAFPSWTEGFGLPIVEAMARGCPVISSNRASMPEVCGNAALLAPPDDPAAWVRNVEALLRSKDLRSDLIGRGSERVRMFSWGHTAEGYLELLREPARLLSSRQTRESAPSLSVSVVVATRGRPQVVEATVRHLLEHQSLQPLAVIVSCVTPEDAGDLKHVKGVTVITGAAGLPAQRNLGLRALPQETEIVVFFDDDFLAEAGWLRAAVEAFQDTPEIVGFTGRLLADDIKGPGLSYPDAAQLLRDVQPDLGSPLEPCSPYGCNMAFRRSAVGDLRFDERLVLYGWLEDRDFGARLAKQTGGRLVKSQRACGVHMGVKGGRVAGDRLGYSQVVNPIYLLRKRSMTLLQVTDHIFRNVASNLLGAIWSEPFIDRRGRLRGNFRAWLDMLGGRLEPERAADIIPSEKV
jgi:glycosyltransferase involved in cell wall biosynthesis